MNLSSNTLNLLKNFAGINVNLLLEKESTVITTVSPSKTVLCSATVPEKIPVEFGIYDLNEFLGALSIFDSPEIDFDEMYCTISESTDKRKKLKYYASEKKNLKTAPVKEIPFDESEIIATFDLSGDTLKNITRSAALMQLDSIAIGIDDDRASIGAENKSTGNEASNNYSVDISDSIKRGKAYDGQLIMHFDKQNINPISGCDFVVTMTKKATKFESVSGSPYNVKYWYSPTTKS